MRRLANLLVVEHALVSRRALRIVAVLTIVVVAVAGAAVTLTDPTSFDSWWEGLWWASGTVTTVGYGDVVPASVAGRLVAVVVTFAGIGLVSILTASLASALLAEDVGDEERQIDRDLAEIRAAIERIEQRLAEHDPPTDAC